MRPGSLSLVTGVLLACPAIARSAEPGCAAAATAPWHADGKTYRIDATSGGTGCAIANVRLTLRRPGGATLLTFTSAAADIPAVFTSATSSAAMRAALGRWIAQPAGGTTTRDLPEWTTGANEPGPRDTPFHPEPVFERARYNQMRRWGQPMLCFVQGKGSEACHALDAKAGTLTLIGTRSLLR